MSSTRQAVDKAQDSVTEQESPAAITEDVEPITSSVPSVGNGAALAANGESPEDDGDHWLAELETLERTESKNNEETRAREADDRRARWDAEYERAEQAATEREAREAKERRERWQADDERLAREAEERRERWRTEYERAELDARSRAVREAEQRRAHWEAEYTRA
jgi:hypothetical protein